MLWEDLLAEVPRLRDGELSVLDAGGGAGHVALRMARLGNEVLLCDPSREMLDRAEETACGQELSGSVATAHASIQELDAMAIGRFDVITCHAVLEWLADPKAVLDHLGTLLKDDGRLSLMFYNQNAAILKRVLRGDFAEALQTPNRTGGDADCTPLQEETVGSWLNEQGLRVLSKAGIRVFHDHLHGQVWGREGLEELLKTEKALRKMEPFASLGQHVHLVCERG